MSSRDIIISVIALALTAFLTGADIRETHYPAEIRGIGDSPNFPLVAAGFERAEMMTYAPGMTDISIGYNLLSPDVQIAATIYFSGKNSGFPNLSDQLLAEKQNIERYHPDAQLIGEEVINLEKNGNSYSANKVSYRFNDKFMRRQQVVYSELILWTHGNKYIKLRSTTPISQKERARDKNMELLRAVNWAY